MDDLANRLRDAGVALLDLRSDLVAGEPWRLSDAWGTEPEANWGPREVLAHVNEMLPYWTDQLELVLAGDAATAVPFGRVATDPARLRRIGTDRQRPATELVDDIVAGLERAGTFAAGMSDADGARCGLHSTGGVFTVQAAIDRFLVTHLEEHVAQLRGILERPAADGQPPA